MPSCAKAKETRNDLPRSGRYWIANPGPVCMTERALSPDSLLVAACRRWPSGERDAAIHTAAGHIKCWDSFLHVVKRHRVTALVADAFRYAGVALPACTAQELAELVGRHSQRSLKLAAETVPLQGLLTAAGIPVMVLKGAALEQLVYGRLAAKQTRDIDLFVPPDCAEAALLILERNGYELSLPAKQLNTMQRQALIRHGREGELVHPRKRLRAELQWRAADNPLLLKGVDALSATQDVVLADGIVVRTLAPDDLFAYLCVHGARHAWSRLKWLADLNALLVSTNADIEHLYRHAQRIGAGLCAAQALL